MTPSILTLAERFLNVYTNSSICKRRREFFSVIFVLLFLTVDV